ncbi:UDP-D-apiose/UDP-D-xylose synthase-like [Bidens hawaiensis]|uniref:UDP-D-apiose/UDP-D-xylose synthase-like n=1 Tax=Bidens hawaiensis TaxID=980011 RepID=UPI00404AADE4
MECRRRVGRHALHHICVSMVPIIDILGMKCRPTVNLAAICTPVDYNTRLLDTIYSNFIDVLPVYSMINGSLVSSSSTRSSTVQRITSGSFTFPLVKCMGKLSVAFFPGLMVPVRVFQEFYHALALHGYLTYFHPVLFKNLLRHEPLKLVDDGQSQRTFVYIKDAIEAVHLMIENPARANGHIFNGS